MDLRTIQSSPHSLHPDKGGDECYCQSDKMHMDEKWYTANHPSIPNRALMSAVAMAIF